MSIANNRKAFHDYFIEEQIEAGLVLEGWEVKAIRAGRVQLKESYIHWKRDAFYLVGCHITALPEASTHVKPDPVRQRKLLLNRREMNKLIGKTERAGYTIVPLNLHYQRGFIKAEIVSFDDLDAAGSMAAARAAGKVRQEGKEYVMQDGDVVLFRFNV